MLITNPSSAVRAVDEANPAAIGIVDHGVGSNSLIFDRIGKDLRVDYHGHADHRRVAGGTASCPRCFPRNIAIGIRLERGAERHRGLQGHPGAAVRRPLEPRVRARADPQAEAGGTVIGDALKAAVLLFVAVLVQISLASAYAPLGRKRERRARRADRRLAAARLDLRRRRGLRHRTSARHGEPGRARLHLAAA